MAEYLTTSEAAEKMEVSPATVRRLIEDEELDGKRRTKSGPWLVSEESIEKYLEEIESGERESPDYAKGFDAGYDEGFSDAEAETKPDDEDEDPDDEDDESEDDEDDDEEDKGDR